MQPMTIGRFEVRRVEEMIWTISPRFLFSQLTYADFEPHRDWLIPHFSAAELKLRLSIHTFVIRTPHHTILIDTCIGNDRTRDVPLWNHMRTDYLDKLAAAGVQPEQVDYVFCTHMHVDHVGWNTRLDNGRWVPTFPNAKYLFHRTEWEFWKDTEEKNQAEVVKDSLLPIVDAGLAVMVEADYAIEDGIRLLPTPGHTPGHCSVHLSSGGAEAVITGDMIHHPAQVAEPHWTIRVCWNPALDIKTRTEFVQRYADTSTWILGTHFAPPTAVHIVSHGESLRVRY
jgi:glyoxylase-like metal-dependent hydrolase (beta-lactamase superfamily II)